ncbi:Hypothetical leucine rich repeat protein [Ectocarpus siliculosus]|uniref:Hypothetical leucine rich repeat protein n=1 Tax=Ectocarpus siliculosus TaxID=2880 RepID=D8LBY4_ECTSI|nr:Hypothetical leucine rich repeat protein [Ectocarpus siliculosus]|eukprot:CBN79167.1 Hypothetical leucine rich repeat protein [Ectocarpus siliculosus]
MSTSPIPNAWGALQGLAHRALGSNQLAGSIPPELGSFAALTHLELGENSQTMRTIPKELGALTELKESFPSYNQLLDTRPIPNAWGALQGLAHLALGSNQLAGSIPPELGNLAALACLDLRENQL